MSLAVKLGGTQNKAWAESIQNMYIPYLDTSRFGYKLLEKMGWEEGKGLGKNNSGQLTHIKVKKKGDTLGLGVDDSNLANKHFLSAANSYTEILKQLNEKHSEERKLVEDSKSKKRKLSIDNGEEEKRVYKLHKLLKNKNVKNYSKEDLTIITGTPREGDDDEEKELKIETNNDSVNVSEKIKVETDKSEKEVESEKKKKKDKKKKKEEKKHKKHHHHKNKE